MKRSRVNSILLGLIFLSLVGGVLFLNNPELFRKKSEKLKGTVQKPQGYTCSVYSGPIDHVFSARGTVGGEDERRTVVAEDANADNTSFNVERGMDFSAAETLAVVSGAPLAAPCSGKLIDYRFDAAENRLTLELLDYDALCIRSSVKADKLSRLDYKTPVRVWYRRKKYEASICYIAYEIEDGSVELRVCLPEELRLLPGEELDLEFVIGTTNKGKYVFSEAVLRDFDGSAYAFAYDEDGRTLVKRPLTVGETFTVEEDDDLREFTEILSGAEEGDQFFVEELDGAQPSLEELIHG